MSAIAYEAVVTLTMLFKIVFIRTEAAVVAPVAVEKYLVAPGKNISGKE